MKNKFFLACFLILNCQFVYPQTKDKITFQYYLSKFSQPKLPQVISDTSMKSWNSFKRNTKDFISESEIKKFLCVNTSCLCDNSRYLYNYWMKTPTKNNAFILTMVSMINDNEGDNHDLNYGLSYYLFTTYSIQGELLSQIIVGKARDNYLPNYTSIVKISQDTIYNKTVGPYALDFTKSKDDTMCNVSEDYFIIDSNGVFVKRAKTKITKINITWDKTKRKVVF
jgi:hypothetical protein